MRPSSASPRAPRPSSEGSSSSRRAANPRPASWTPSPPAAKTSSPTAPAAPAAATSNRRLGAPASGRHRGPGGPRNCTTPLTHTTETARTTGLQTAGTAGLQTGTRGAPHHARRNPTHPHGACAPDHHPPDHPDDATAWNAGLQTGTAALRAAHVVTLASLTAERPGTGPTTVTCSIPSGSANATCTRPADSASATCSPRRTRYCYMYPASQLR